MNSQVTKELLDPIRLFMRDFSTFAGAKITALLFLFLGAVVEGIGFVLLIPFFSVVMESKDAGSWIQSAAARLFALFAAETRLSKLSLLVALFAVLMVFRLVIVVVRDVTMAQLAIGFVQHVRSRITRRLASARWDTVSRLRHSRITHLMSTDIQQFDNAINLLLHDVVAVVVLVSQLVLAFLLAPLLALLAVGVVLFGTAALLAMMNRARRIGRFVTNANLSLIDDITQFLGGLKLAISQNLQKSFTREFDEALGELKAREVRYVQQQTIARLAVASISGIVGAVFILIGVIAFNISAPALITLLLILSRMSGPATTLQVDAPQITQALSAYEKIRELENELIVAEASDNSLDPVIGLPDGPITFSGASFVHKKSADPTGGVGGVRELNLIIEPGSIVGITGPSGAGKTTFADLLVGLYPPQTGEITVGNVPLCGPSVKAWRNSVSYVVQDPFLFHDTIRRNLLWATDKADEAALWSVLRMVGAEDIVRKGLRGLDTVVGERGSLLSGGERQRLCLARALLRHPRLLVLDEATSAIDTEGEQVLLDRLLEAKPRPTIVMIAHRRESLRRCQRVFSFEGGKIVSDVSDRPEAPNMSALFTG